MASSCIAQQISGASISSAPVNTSAVPHLVSYGGVLKDGSGKPVTGITGVTFLLYRDQEGGAPVWMETQNVKPDNAGRYSAQLGATRSEGLPPETFMTGEARWLAVQAAGAPEQPRVLLVAVPYAMKAADAETIGGLPPSAFMLAVPSRSGAGGTSGGEASSRPSAGCNSSRVERNNERRDRECSAAVDDGDECTKLGDHANGKRSHGEDRHWDDGSGGGARREGRASMCAVRSLFPLPGTPLRPRARIRSRRTLLLLHSAM